MHRWGGQNRKEAAVLWSGSLLLPVYVTHQLIRVLPTLTDTGRTLSSETLMACQVVTSLKQLEFELGACLTVPY